MSNNAEVSKQPDPNLWIRVEDNIRQAENQYKKSEPDLFVVRSAISQALHLMEDQFSSQALNLKGKLGELWLTLVERTADLHHAESVLEQGLKYFSDLPVGDSLRSMRKNTQKVIHLGQSLEISPGNEWPNWFEEPRGPNELLSQVDTANYILQESSWEFLRERAAHYKTVLLDQYLPAYINHLLQNIRQQARQGDFARSSQNTQIALNFFTDELITHISTKTDYSSLKRLKDAIDARQRSEVALWTAIVKALEESSSISDALSETNLELPEHPDVGVDDLRLTLEELEEAAQIEANLDKLFQGEYYQVDFEYLKDRGDIQLNILVNPPNFLLQSDPTTARKLQRLLREFREKSLNAPENAARILVAELDTHITNVHQGLATTIPQGMFKSYWSLIWILERELCDDPNLRKKAQDVLAAARRLPQERLLKAAAFFNDIQNDQSLNRFLQELNTIQELNSGLARYPQSSDTNQNQIALPLLPADIKLPETQTQLDINALMRWQEIVSLWLSRSKEEVLAISEGDSVEEKLWDLEMLESGILEYLNEIIEIRDEIYLKIDFLDWDQNSNLGKMGNDCGILLQIVNALQFIEEGLDSTEATENAGIWTQRLQEPGLIDSLNQPFIWLLDPYRAALNRKVNSIKEEIKFSLNDEVGQILQSHPTSVSQLRNLIISAALYEPFIESVSKSVEEQALTLARAAQSKDDHEIAVVLWDSVRRAADPEVLEGTNQTAIHLHELHRKANWEYRKAKIWTRRQPILLSGLVVVLIALSFLSITWFRQVQGSAAPVVLAAETSTMTQTVAKTPTFTSIEDGRALTSTAAQLAAFNATQQMEDMLTATEAAQEQITATARQSVFLAQTTTAQAQQTEVVNQTSTAQVLKATEAAEEATATALADPALQATSAALRCIEDSTAYQVEVLEGPELNPDLGSIFVIGNPVFPATASWTVRNTGECDWHELLVEPGQDSRQVKYFFLDGSEMFEIAPENPLEVGQSLKIFLSFPLLEARDVNGSWFLVANGYQIGDSAQFRLEVDDWILAVQPSPTPTTKPPSSGGGEPEPTAEVTPTARPTEAPPTARP